MTFDRIVLRSLRALLVVCVVGLGTTSCLAEVTVSQDNANRASTIDFISQQELDQATQVDLDQVELAADELNEVENASPIPEPAAAAMLLAGLGGMAWMRYRLG